MNHYAKCGCFRGEMGFLDFDVNGHGSKDYKRCLKHR